MSDGGLAQALVESCLRHGVGATVSLLGDPFVGLFSESAARAIVTVPPDRLEAFLTMAASLGVPAGASRSPWTMSAQPGAPPSPPPSAADPPALDVRASPCEHGEAGTSAHPTPGAIGSEPPG